MNTSTRTRMSMATRARDFAIANPIPDSGFTVVLKRLEDAITEGTAMAQQVSGGFMYEHGATGQRSALYESIYNRLRRLIRTASLASQTTPELQSLTRMPSVSGPRRNLIVATRAMIAAALPYKDALVALGLGDTFFDDLTRDTDQYDAVTGSAHSGRSNHVTANAALPNLMRECHRDVAVLGTFYIERYGRGSDVVAGWLSASNIAGPFHTAAQAPEPTPEPAPVPAAQPTQALLAPSVNDTGKPTISS